MDDNLLLPAPPPLPRFPFNKTVDSVCVRISQCKVIVLDGNYGLVGENTYKLSFEKLTLMR